MATTDTAPSSRKPLIWERLRGLFHEAWKRARRRRHRLLAAGLLVTAAAAAVLVLQVNGGPPSPTTPQLVLRLPLAAQLNPVVAGKHDRIVVTMTAQHSTGIVGKAVHAYVAAATISDPKVDCVNNRDGGFPYSAAGSRIRAVLDPAAGDGGPQGWCPGAYHGTISYLRGFNCSSVQGPCQIPPRLATRTKIVARFAYRVR
jgi:hypothetical protein